MNRTHLNNIANGKTQQGVTLIELMIVVVILSIIAAVGYPAYIQHTTKSRRAAAESFLLSVANKQEQYMLDARIYADTLAKLNLTTLPAEVSPHYTIALSNITNTTYTITATPIAGQLASDTTCATLGLDQTGLKGRMISGVLTAAPACW